MTRKPKSRTVDKLLYQLRKRPDAYRCHPTDPHKWTASCPACGEAMGISEQPWGKWQILLLCAGGCDDQTILSALANDPGNSEYLAWLEAQDGIAEEEFARRDRARHARRELQTWQSTTTSSPSTASTKTARHPVGATPATPARGGPSSPASMPAST